MPDSIYCHVHACLFSSSLASKQRKRARGFTQCSVSAPGLGLFHSWMNGVNPLVSHAVSLSLRRDPGPLALATHTECSKWASCGATRGKKTIAKPNATAPVWEYFGFKPNEQGEPNNTDEPVCRICSKVVGLLLQSGNKKKATQQTCMPYMLTIILFIRNNLWDNISSSKIC